MISYMNTKISITFVYGNALLIAATAKLVHGIWRTPVIDPLPNISNQNTYTLVTCARIKFIEALYIQYYRFHLI